MLYQDPTNLGFILCDTARLLKDRYHVRVKSLGLSRSEWLVVATVRRFQGMHQAALAERLEIEPITLTRLLERMEKSGWIVRKSDEHDKRVRCVFLSEKAKPLQSKMRNFGNELVEESLRGVSEDLYPHLYEALAKMNANLLGMPKHKAGVAAKRKGRA